MSACIRRDTKGMVFRERYEMMVFVYDGSFEGLLTAIYEAYYSGAVPHRIIDSVNMQFNLLDEFRHIQTDMVKSGKVYRSIRSRISEEALQHVYHVYLSEAEDAGTLIYDYLKLGWKLGSKVDLCLSDDRVLKVHDTSRRVEFETHRLLGFVRFSQVEGGIYYASISPDNNIVELLAPHFAERLSNQPWIIHDVKRGLAALYNSKDWIVTDFYNDDEPATTKEEAEYRALWKGFFNTIAIKSRENPGLQKQLMPKRYWRHITEKW